MKTSSLYPGDSGDKETTDDSIALVPTINKHSSGFALIAIVCFDKNVDPAASVAYGDDVGHAIIERIPIGHLSREHRAKKDCTYLHPDSPSRPYDDAAHG